MKLPEEREWNGRERKRLHKCVNCNLGERTVVGGMLGPSSGQQYCASLEVSVAKVFENNH